jgi:hypothetical protein
MVGRRCLALLVVALGATVGRPAGATTTGRAVRACGPEVYQPDRAPGMEVAPSIGWDVALDGQVQLTFRHTDPEPIRQLVRERPIWLRSGLDGDRVRMAVVDVTEASGPRPRAIRVTLRATSPLVDGRTYHLSEWGLRWTARRSAPSIVVDRSPPAEVLPEEAARSAVEEREVRAHEAALAFRGAFARFGPPPAAPWWRVLAALAAALVVLAGLSRAAARRLPASHV